MFSPRKPGETVGWQTTVGAEGSRVGRAGDEF